MRMYSRNADFQRIMSLKTNRNKRHRQKMFFVEGVRNINAAVKYGFEIASFIHTPTDRLSRWAQDMLRDVQTDENYETSTELMREISEKEDASELAAIIHMKRERIPTVQNGVYMLFDRPSNKGNLGTVLRSCDAFGAAGLIITGHAVDIYDPEVISASMGSFFSVPFAHMPSLTELDEQIEMMRQKLPGFCVAGTSAHAEFDLNSGCMTPPILIMIGNETDGMSHALKERADILVTIPMAKTSSASSLNVACAATVLLYAVQTVTMM